MDHSSERARPCGIGRALSMAWLTLIVTTSGAMAQGPDPLPWPDGQPEARDDVDGFAWRGSTSEFWLPLGSILLPGLGQYVHGAWLPGLGHTGAAGLGYALATVGDPTADRPREWRDQLAYAGLHLTVTSGFTSAWDTFRRAVEGGGRGGGRYAFFEPEDDLERLLGAPFDPTFLGRWTTWVSLAQSALVTGLVLASRDDGTAYEPYRAHDAAYAGSVSLNAAVGEEAAFRGWLLPLMTEKFGRRFWLANTAQALVFGAGHPRAGPYALVITAWGAYAGWLTRRNDWSVREAVFQHFWHNAMVVTASLLVDEAGSRPLVSFRIPLP